MKQAINIVLYHIALLVLFLPVRLAAQRSYHDSSVLATGDWYKIEVREAGIYKVDRALLRSMGINTTIPSSSIRLYGNGGGMLPESCAGRVIDDLQENPLQISDGGDGIFDGSDYFLFYAGGPDSWVWDAATHAFAHRKNLYSSGSYYFIGFGGTGKRIATLASSSTSGQTITSFDEHYFYELDTVNLLNSGKSWYGEDFTTTGKYASRSFTLPMQNLLPGTGTITSDCIARSIGTSSSFTVSINNVPVLQHSLPAVGSGNLDLFATSSQLVNSFVLSGNPLTVNYAFQSGAYGAQGWLNWFELTARRSLSLAGTSQLLFRDVNSVAQGASGKFVVQGATATAQVWDITDPLTPYRLDASSTGSMLQFQNDCSILHEYIAFNGTAFLLPAPAGKIASQNLHHSSPADLVVITHPAVYQQAMRLATYHEQHDHLRTVVVNASAIYNEFASGIPDPTALRDFVKMYYDKAGSDPGKRPRYLLLFGDATYDYRNYLKNGGNFVPPYESPASTDPLTTYTSDDFFGFLDDGEDINSDTVMNGLDIGIGRIPAATNAQAKAYVDKLMQYNDTSTMGSWRNELTFVADDEDFNLHFHDAESIAATAGTVNAAFTPQKIYLDAFRQESTPAGSRYPLVNQEINNRINQGTLVWNYSGHGSSRRLAEEVVLDQDIVASWNNAGKLPLFITATCDFAPYDNPANYSLGENILLREKTGAIALMTTTRLVFAYSNRIMNQNYMQVALQPKPGGGYRSLGEAVMDAKNNTYRSYSDKINNRKFTLLGDPALTLDFPVNSVQTTSLNARPLSGTGDTLKALQQYVVGGRITDRTGTFLSNFNGTVSITVYDKAQMATTLGNDPESIPENFSIQNNVLFKGKASVANGQFTYSFVVPKDVNYLFGQGKISYYARSAETDANGSYSGFVIGGSQGPGADAKGPEVRAYLNDENFVNGGATSPDPLLIVHLADSSGINILGTGIGHDVTATLDDGKQVYVLNSFFESDLNSFQKGTIRYNLAALTEGIHTLRIKAWDVLNNSGEAAITFMVARKRTFSILRVINFPNPVITTTTFHFEHDAAVQQMQVSVRILTEKGELIKTIKKTINTGGSRFGDVEWDGTDDRGAPLHKGIYFYQVTAATDVDTRSTKAGKLLIW